MLAEEYVMYLRKSRADQEAELRGEGETFARHEKLLTDTAATLKIKIGAIYREVVTGESIAARPEMQKLLREIEADIWRGVLVVEVERLARGDTMDQGQVAKSFKINNSKIVTPMKIYDPSNEFDEEYFEFGLFMSRREYKTINRRLQRGRIASVQEGKYIASVAPYGYKKIRVPHDKGFTLEIVPNEAEVVKQIFNWYTHDNIGMTAICQKLDAMKIPPKIGEIWSRSSIKDMLSNPTYVGKVRWQWKKEIKNYDNGQVSKTRQKSTDYLLYDGIHDAIIDDETFDAVQKKLKSNHKYITNSKDIKNPLTGLIYCEKCKRLMTRLAPNKKTAYAALKCPNPYCDNVSAPLDLVENELILALEKWLKDYTFEWELNTSNQEQGHAELINESIKKCRNNIATLKIQYEKTFELLETGVYTPEVFSARNKTISSQLETAQLDLKNLTQELDNENSRMEARITFIPKIKKLLSVYDKLDVKTRNDLLKEILEKVEYLKIEKNTRSKRFNANFELTLYPNIK